MYKFRNNVANGDNQLISRIRCYFNTNENGINNLLYDAGMFIKMLTDTNKDANYYMSVMFDESMFNKQKYVVDKRKNGVPFNNYIDTVIDKAANEAVNWFKSNFKLILDKISKSNIDDADEIKFMKEMNRVSALLIQETANIDARDCLRLGFDIDLKSDTVDTEVAYIKNKICDMLKVIKNELVKICLTDAEAIKLQQQNQSTTNHQQVNNNINQSVNMTNQQPFIYPFSMGPIVNNSEPINMAPFTVPISYTPAYNDPDIMKHFIITDCVKVNNKQDECDFEALLKRIALVMDQKDAELKLKNPSKFAFTYFINTKCWKMERVNKNNAPFNEGDNNYQCIYQNGTDKPQWFCRNKHAA